MLVSAIRSNEAKQRRGRNRPASAPMTRKRETLQSQIGTFHETQTRADKGKRKGRKNRPLPGLQKARNTTFYLRDDAEDQK